MIQRETITNDNGNEFIRTYSDAGMLITRDGVYYAEAVDPLALANDRTYTETNIPDVVAEPTDAEYAEAGRILLGAEQWQA